MIVRRRQCKGYAKDYNTHRYYHNIHSLQPMLDYVDEKGTHSNPGDELSIPAAAVGVDEKTSRNVNGLK